METGMIVLMVVSALIGLLVGVFLGKRIIKRKETVGIQGILNVDCSDPNSDPGLWLQLEVPIEDIATREQAIFIVKLIR